MNPGAPEGQAFPAHAGIPLRHEMNPDAPEGYAFPAHEGVWSQQLHVTDEFHQEVYQVPQIEHAVIKIDDRVSTIEER